MIPMINILCHTRVATIDGTRAGLTRDGGLNRTQEAVACVAEPREHQHVRLELCQVPLHDHLGDGGQLHAVARVPVQGVLASSHQTQLSHQSAQGRVLGSVALNTRERTGTKIGII